MAYIETASHVMILVLGFHMQKSQYPTKSLSASFSVAVACSAKLCDTRTKAHSLDDVPTFIPTSVH